jgi:pimeloyl-ACP methyl ester carboxylesterase
MLGNDPVGYLRSQAVFATGDDDLVGRVDTIRCPSLIITGEFDSGSTPDMSVRLGAHIAGSKVVILEGLRHLLPIEAPEQLLQHMNPFLRTVTPSRHA